MDLPSDTREELRERFEEVATASEQRDTERATGALAAVERTVAAEVPPGGGREAIEHGVARVRVLVRDEPLVAAEWARAVGRLVGDGTGGRARSPRGEDVQGEPGDGEESRRDCSDGTD
jgi:hypothetical protein